MTNYGRLIRTIEEQLREMKFESEEEEDKQRRIMYKAFRVEMDGFKSQDIELPEGSILVGVSKGELKHATASAGQLWVGKESFTSISGAAFKATGTRTLTGWNFWTMVYIPRKGWMNVSDLRLTNRRPYSSESK